MKKVNSFFIEFEPIQPVVWYEVLSPFRKQLESWGIRIVTWETGIVEVPSTEDEQKDLFT